jgi:hypothetical protein
VRIRISRSGAGSSAARTLPISRMCCRRGAQRGMAVPEGSSLRCTSQRRWPCSRWPSGAHVRLSVRAHRHPIRPTSSCASRHNDSYRLLSGTLHSHLCSWRRWRLPARRGCNGGPPPALAERSRSLAPLWFGLNGFADEWGCCVLRRSRCSVGSRLVRHHRLRTRWVSARVVQAPASWWRSANSTRLRANESSGKQAHGRCRSSLLASYFYLERSTGGSTHGDGTNRRQSPTIATSHQGHDAPAVDAAVGARARRIVCELRGWRRTGRGHLAMRRSPCDSSASGEYRGQTAAVTVARFP